MSIKSSFKGIKGKLIMAAVLPFAGFFVCGWTAYRGINELSAVIQSAHQTLIPTLERLGTMRSARNQMGYHIFAAIHYVNDPIIKEKRIKLFDAAMEQFIKAQDAYEKTNFTAEEKARYQPVHGHKEEYRSLLKQVMKHVENGTPKDIEQATNILNTRLLAVGSELANYNEEAAKYYEEKALAEEKEATQSAHTILLTMVSITVAGGCLIFILLGYVGVTISRAVSDITQQMSNSNEHVASAIQQLQNAGGNLSDSATSAAASLQETVASLEEMSSMVQRNSDHAKEAASLSQSSREIAERGEREMADLITSMKEISESSRKIEEIINVIDDIAFQTNLLALNAAVEAARAGEQGKGFSVVAEAVRGLAQRSAIAAKDISSLIKSSVSRIEHGTEVADRSGEVLNQIVTSVKKVADLNGEISVASTEQTQGIQQISKAMNQLDEASQTNASSAQDVAKASDDIRNLIDSSRELHQKLDVLIAGQKSA